MGKAARLEETCMVPLAMGESRAVAAIYEELRLPPRARESLGAAFLRDFEFISMANLENAAGRVLTT
eukprot:2820261-Amphidinium_carterae.1